MKKSSAKKASKKTSKKAAKKSAPKRAKAAVKAKRSAAAAKSKSKVQSKSAPTRRETSRTPEVDVKSKKDFRADEQENQESSEQPFERLGRKSKQSGKPETVESGRYTQFADEQDIAKDDMDVVVDESMGDSEEETPEEDHSPRQYHRAEDLEQHKKEVARRPKGHAQAGPTLHHDGPNRTKRS